MVYGLTGGVGMGKSTAARLIAECRVSVVDSDDLAREVVAVGEPALTEIAETFGAEYLDEDGKLDRKKMAKLVFNDERARKKLEAIIHPRVRECWQAMVAEWRAAGQGGVVVIPLLFEVEAQGEFDAVLCVACTTSTQRERLRLRGWDAKQIDARIEAQMGVAAKIELADHVLWNEGSVDALRDQITRILS